MDTWFALQLMLIEAFELGDDIIRGNIAPANPREAIRDAQHLAHLEMTHGLFLEPSIQLLVRHVHALFGLVPYGALVRATELAYVAGQTIVPLVLVVWISRKHRDYWPLVRSIAYLMVLEAAIRQHGIPEALVWGKTDSLARISPGPPRLQSRPARLRAAPR